MLGWVLMGLGAFFLADAVIVPINWVKVWNKRLGPSSEAGVFVVMAQAIWLATGFCALGVVLLLIGIVYSITVRV